MSWCSCGLLLLPHLMVVGGGSAAAAHIIIPSLCHQQPCRGRLVRCCIVVELGGAPPSHYHHHHLLLVHASRRRSSLWLARFASCWPCTLSWATAVHSLSMAFICPSLAERRRDNRWRRLLWCPRATNNKGRPPVVRTKAPCAGSTRGGWYAPPPLADPSKASPNPEEGKRSILSSPHAASRPAAAADDVR